MTEQEMLKEALEWQEHIRKLITATDDELYHKRSKVFDWLLERVQVLEKENKRYREAMVSALSEIEYALYSQKSLKVKEHYLKNAKRYINQALESDEN